MGLSGEDSDAQVDASDIDLLHRLSVSFIGEHKLEVLHERIMDVAVAIMRSQFASMQMVDASRGRGDELRLLAFRGFSPEAAKFWEWVGIDSAGSTCSEALRTGRRVIAADVETCDYIGDTEYLLTYRQTGIRGCQSTPLLSRAGDLIGMISTHWSRPHEPSDRHLRFMDILARQASDLLERAQSKEALQMSEDRFDSMRHRAEQQSAYLAAIIENSEDAIISKGLDGVIKSWNAGAERLFGYTTEEAVGRSITLLIPPDRLDEEVKIIEQLKRGERVDYFETKRRRKDGMLIDISLTISPVKDAQGRIIAASKVARDITERKRAEMLAAEQNRLLERVAGGESTEECLTELSRAVSRLHPGVHAGVFIANVERDAIENGFFAFADPTFQMGIVGCPINQTPKGTCGTAILEGRPVACADIALDKRFSQLFRNHCLAHGFKACRSTPVFVADGNAIASFVMLFAEPHEADAWELKIAEFGAHFARIVLERDRAAQALRERQEFNRSLMQSSADCVKVLDLDGLVLFINGPGVCLLEGDSAADFCGVPWVSHWPEEAHNEVERALTSARAGQSYSFKAPCLTVKGTEKWWDVSVTPVRDDADGRIVRLLSVSREVTQQMASESALRESEERFRTMTDNISQLAWTCDTLGEVTWYNKRWLEYTGLTLDTMKDWGWKQIHHPDHVERVVASVSRSRESGELWEDTFPLRSVSGEYRWFLSRAAPIRDESGKIIRWFGTNTDITERLEAEETQRMLSAELSHRVKNMLATVQAIATQTLRQNSDPVEFAKSFGARIQSMSRMHSLLSSGGWQGADLRDVIRDQLLMGPIDETRVTAWGPAAHLDRQLAPQIAMILHELGTNSIKYGALSLPSGVVTISWSVNNGTLELIWTERGGPPPKAPTRRGFGTIFIEQSAKTLGGSARMSIGHTGVNWQFALPMPRLQSTPEARSEFVKTAPQETLPITDTRQSLLATMRILIVEDEPLVALDAITALEEAGALVTGPVGTVKEALATIESQTFDAALLDANLRGDPIDEIGAALTRRKVPFVFVTGYGKESLPQVFRTAPMLSKPFSQEQLLELIARFVQTPATVLKLKN